MLRNLIRNAPCSVLLLALLSVYGCGGGNIAPVTGTVKLDGQPLEGANVTFWPMDAKTDRPSGGVTDSSGQYRLMYTADEPGALIGQQKVEISTAVSSEEGTTPERLPARYNSSTELTAEVTSGRNTIDFDLTSQ